MTNTTDCRRSVAGPSRAVWALMSALLVLSVLVLGGCAAEEQASSDLGEPPEGPALAVLQLAEAAEAGDLTDVRTYMDSSSVGVAFARQTLGRLDESDTSTTSAPPAAGHGASFNPNAMERTFAERFVEAFQTGVADGTVVAKGTLFAEILTAGPGSVESLSDTEALVSVEMPAREDSEAHTVRLRMNRAGQRWMLTAIEDTTDLYGLFF